MVLILVGHTMCSRCLAVQLATSLVNVIQRHLCSTLSVWCDLMSCCLLAGSAADMQSTTPSINFSCTLKCMFFDHFAGGEEVLRPEVLKRRCLRPPILAADPLNVLLLITLMTCCFACMKGAWNRLFGLLIIDQPIGTGYSPAGSKRLPADILAAAADLYTGLLGVFDRHPGLQERPFVITGESYGGSTLECRIQH